MWVQASACKRRAQPGVPLHFVVRQDTFLFQLAVRPRHRIVILHAVIPLSSSARPPQRTSRNALAASRSSALNSETSAPILAHPAPLTDIFVPPSSRNSRPPSRTFPIFNFPPSACTSAIRSRFGTDPLVAVQLRVPRRPRLSSPVSVRTRDAPHAAQAIVATNLPGPIRLTAALLPPLQKQTYSAIMNVSSGLAFVPLSPTPTHCATKAASTLTRNLCDISCVEPRSKFWNSLHRMSQRT